MPLFISCRSALTALTLSGIAAYLLIPVPFPETASKITARGQATVVLDQAMSAKDAKRIAKSFSVDGPPEGGVFLRGRHGVTFYTLDGDNLDKLVVLAHGLGTSLRIYDDFVEPLVKAGYSVLRYDYFGHGWSVPDDKIPTVDKHVLMNQLEDLLDTVFAGLPDAKTHPVHTIVGHSTGGVVGTLASETDLQAHPVKNMFLVSPAYYAVKPTIAKIADNIPGVLQAVFRRKLLHSLISDAYAENGVNSWGRDASGKYHFAERRSAQEALNAKMFANHPFIIGGIFGINSYLLTEPLLATYRDLMSRSKCRTLIAWGVLDIVVPYVRCGYSC